MSTKMSSTALYSILLLALIPYHVQGRECLPALTTQVPYPTPSPINIITSKAIPSNVTSPLKIVTAIFALLKVVNIGNTIEVYLNEATDNSYITGGVLCNEKYKFHKGVFVNNLNPFARSGSAVNGFGAPIGSFAIYYHIKYDSFNKARNEPDGLVQLSSLVNVGPVFNPLFIPTEFFLKSGAIRRPGSSGYIPAFLFFPWMFESVPNTEYYAYKGTYTDPTTGNTYASSINIIQSVRQFISFEQFSAYGNNILDSDGKPVNATDLLQPQGKRPIYSGFGFNPQFTLF